MRYIIAILVMIVLANISSGDDQLQSSIESFYTDYHTFGNPNVPPEYDCAVRAFNIEMAAYIAPPALKTNWTKLSQSAFQMKQCNITSDAAFQPSSSARPFKIAPDMKKGLCQHTVFVHDGKGNDLFDGTFQSPMKTDPSSSYLLHVLYVLVQGSDGTLCITIRGGTYYLGTNASTTSSQIGAIALTSNDSNLVIENYQDEVVVLSGGALLQLQWSIHAKTAAGGTIMKAQVPDFINLDHVQ